MLPVDSGCTLDLADDPTCLCISLTWNAHILIFVGPRTQKALEAPCRALIMDVGQAERNLRARPLCTPTGNANLYHCESFVHRLRVPPPVPTSFANPSPSPSSSVTG